jgi:tetratricopeptide (TPR) repeat protein
MDIKDLKANANAYDELGWHFSSAMIWQKIIETSPTAFNLTQYVEQLRLSGNYVKAQEVLKRINKKDIPSDYKFMYYIRLGMIYQDQGKIKPAIESFRKSIKMGTTETYPYVFLAVLLSKQNKLEESEAVLLEALNKNGDIDEVYYNLSTNYARRGNFQKAIDMMKECLKIDINYPNAKAFLEDFENLNRTLNNE